MHVQGNRGYLFDRVYRNQHYTWGELQSSAGCGHGHHIAFDVLCLECTVLQCAASCGYDHHIALRVYMHYTWS